MLKPVVSFLIGIGLLLIIFGLTSNKKILILGCVIFLLGIYLGQKIIGKDQVLDTWAILIGGGQGKAEDIFKNTETFITDSKAPSLRLENREMTTGIMGKGRQFLVITDLTSSKITPYQIFINARDYGNNLDVSWYLTYRPGILQSFFMLLLPWLSFVPKTLNDLDLFDQQDLRAYVTNAHHCLQKAVDKLMIGLNQDPSKIDRKSKGFLGIS